MPRDPDCLAQYLVNQRPCRDCGAGARAPHVATCSEPARLARQYRELCLVDVRGAGRRRAHLLVALEAANLRALERWIAGGRPL